MLACKRQGANTRVARLSTPLPRPPRPAPLPSPSRSGQLRLRWALGWRNAFRRHVNLFADVTPRGHSLALALGALVRAVASARGVVRNDGATTDAVEAAASGRLCRLLCLCAACACLAQRGLGRVQTDIVFWLFGILCLVTLSLSHWAGLYGVAGENAPSMPKRALAIDLSLPLPGLNTTLL